MTDLPLTRSRLIQAGAEMRDKQDAWDWIVGILVAATIIVGAAVASAICGA